MAKKPKIPGSLTTKHWVGYMFGDWGGCMTFALMASIFSMYCTDVLGINATVMGVLTIIWTIWDAINDPMMGALMDKAFAKKQKLSEKEYEELKKKTKDNTSRYDYLLTLESLIKTVDGSVYTPAQLESFILKLPMADANYLLQKADKLNEKVGVETTVTATCPNCGNEVVSPFLITSEFFGPTID